MKKKCAKAAFSLIKDAKTVGLGGGETIRYLAGFIQEAGLDINIVTPSQDTASFCQQAGLNVIPVTQIDHIDIAFDGCDQADSHLHALKSKGGIHTMEKIVAAMSDRYILCIDETKFVPVINYPVSVCLEVLPEALPYLKQHLPSYGPVTVRPNLTVHGNKLADITIDGQPDAVSLDQSLKRLAGVVETSIFSNLVTDVLIAKTENAVLINKEGEQEIVYA